MSVEENSKVQLFCEGIQNLLDSIGLPHLESNILPVVASDVLFHTFRYEPVVWNFVGYSGNFLVFKERNTGFEARNYCNPDKPNRYSDALLKAVGRTYEDVENKKLNNFSVKARCSQYRSDNGKIYYSLVEIQPYLW